MRVDYIEDPLLDWSLEVEDPYPGSIPIQGSHEYSDFNGDGFGDMVLSYPGANNGAGSIAIYLSGSRNLSSIISGVDNEHPIGGQVLTSDINGDMIDDLMISNGTSGISIFTGPVDLPQEVNITDAEIFLPIEDALFHSRDVSGDGISDLVCHNSGGSLVFVYEGPIVSSNDTEAADMFDVRFDISGLSIDGDLDGDGIRDFMIWGRNGSIYRLIVVGTAADEVILNVSTSRSIDAAAPADLDGDDVDDLLILSGNASSFGGIFAAFSDNLDTMIGIEDSDWNIGGTTSYPMKDDYLLFPADVDGDGSDDIILGSPGYGPDTNKLALYYCGGSRDWSANITIDSEDASIIEVSDVIRFGRSVITSVDISGDESPMIWYDTSSGPMEWDLFGRGQGPLIIPPSITVWDQNKDLILDFDCETEGDGITYYTIVSAPAGTTINETLGLLGFYPTEADVGSIYFIVKATDEKGGSTVYNHSVEILNLPPVMTNTMPSVLQAGSPVLFYIQTTEDGYVSFSSDRAFPFASLTDTSSGRISGFPLKEDHGVHSMNITIEDSNGGRSDVLWIFSVEADEEMIDPTFTIGDAYISGDSARIRFDISLGNVKESDVGSSFRLVNFIIEDSYGGMVSGVTGPDGNYSSINLGSLLGNLTLTSWINALGRNYTYSYNLGERSPDDNSSTPVVSIWAFILVILILLIITIVAVLFSVERSSYVIQSTISTGGVREDEVVIGQIHEIPGIGYRELCKILNIGKRDLLLTLSELEERRMIYGVFDGPRVRFYPLMGSFRDRPLSLNRYQLKIARELILSGDVDEDDLSVRTGLARSRIRKELSLMDLKGVVTVKERSGSRIYSVNRNQSGRLERILEER